MSRPTIIDTKMHGREGVTACFLVQGEQTAIVETGPKSCLEHVLEGLEEAGIEDLDWIVVTHIHLDHAGAAGTLAERFPNATVAVHHVGAPHLVDPSKLWSSASRIYGDDMDKLWGGIDPIDEGRIRVLSDGDVIDLGGRKLTAVDTPGHAGHHHSYLDDATGFLFSGDALGIRLPQAGLIRPATPPPEFNLDKAVESIRRIAALEPSALWFTHFGPHDTGERVASVAETCEAAIESLRRWEEWVKRAREETRDLDEVAKRVEAEARDYAEGALSPELIDQLQQTTSYWMNTWGYMRYLDKLEASS